MSREYVYSAAFTLFNALLMMKQCTAGMVADMLLQADSFNVNGVSFVLRLQPVYKIHSGLKSYGKQLHTTGGYCGFHVLPHLLFRCFV